MLDELKERDGSLAIVLTTHAMDEADFLCDRVAIMDHGRILCEDSPEALKRGLATGEHVARRDRSRDPAQDRDAILALGAVNWRSPDAVVRGVRSAARRRCRPPRRAARSRIAVTRSVHLTIAPVTLEDVFFSYTGRALREELSGGHDVVFRGAPAGGRRRGEEPRRSRGPRLAFLGILAICQRAYLTLWRQPVLIVSTMLFPVVYLLVLGNCARTGSSRNIPLAVVDEAGNVARRGVPPRRTGARERPRPARGGVSGGPGGGAARACGGAGTAACGCCPSASRRRVPVPSFIGDNTDRFSFDTLDGRA